MTLVQHCGAALSVLGPHEVQRNLSWWGKQERNKHLLSFCHAPGNLHADMWRSGGCDPAKCHNWVLQSDYAWGSTVVSSSLGDVNAVGVPLRTPFPADTPIPSCYECWLLLAHCLTAPENLPQWNGNCCPLLPRNPQPMPDWHGVTKTQLPSFKMGPILWCDVCSRVPWGVRPKFVSTSLLSLTPSPA